MKNKEWKRGKRFVQHHIVNRCRKGKSEPSNLIRLDEQREKAWHFLFGNMDFEEVAELLLRIWRLKQRHKI
jgi:hypothetical protein